jgi:hypothetical protein
MIKRGGQPSSKAKGKKEEGGQSKAGTRSSRQSTRRGAGKKQDSDHTSG